LSEEQNKGKEAKTMKESKAETQETTKEKSIAGAKVVEEAGVAFKALEPMVIGNEKITIIRHDIYRIGGDDTTEAVIIELVAKNVSGVTIGSALFEAELYDIEGNTLNVFEHKTIDLQPSINRKIKMKYSGQDSDKVRSYRVKIAKISNPPEPKVTGNEKIKILKHSLKIDTQSLDYQGQTATADISIRNVSDIKIATLVFEAVFYDIEGNITDIVKRKELELEANTSRAISIRSKPHKDRQLKSYDIRITRMTTSDVEKVQLRRNEIKTTNAGEEVVGIVKNISNVKTDTALVANFFNREKESIGTKVLILRDIEPGNIKQFYFNFKPMEGDKVNSFKLIIGEIVE